MPKISWIELGSLERQTAASSMKWSPPIDKAIRNRRLLTGWLPPISNSPNISSRKAKTRQTGPCSIASYLEPVHIPAHTLQHAPQLPVIIYRLSTTLRLMATQKTLTDAIKEDHQEVCVLSGACTKFKDAPSP